LLGVNCKFHHLKLPTIRQNQQNKRKPPYQFISTHYKVLNFFSLYETCERLITKANSEDLNE
jgi:hypothetical protein